MLENLSQTLAKDCELDTTGPIVVGVSGGPDSLCLLHSMHTLGYEVIVTHFDHGLRLESTTDAKKVEDFSSKYDLVFETESEDIAAYAKEHSLSVEEAARERRYPFLYSVAEKHQAQAVAVGHNADDQAETVLMHLLRGAGLDGLSGMRMHSFNSSWSVSIPLVRPLLATWREEILAYCEEHELEPIFDASNSDTTYFRNRLRHELLLDLETYNPQIKPQLWRMADTLAGDREVVEQHINAVWDKVLVEDSQDYLTFNRQTFLEKGQGVQRRLLRRALNQLRPGLRDLDLDSITRAIKAIQTPPASGQCDLLAGLRVLVENDQFWLARWEAALPLAEDWPQLSKDQAISFEAPGELSIGEGWCLKAESLAGQDGFAKLQHNDPFQAWLTYEEVDHGLSIRGRQAGDRFAPLGMEGHSLKLSDFFINEKLPKRARDAWPLVCIGDEIAWIPGFRPSHNFRVIDPKEQMLYLHLYRYEE